MLVVLPVCRTFNKFIHKILAKVSIRLLAFYLSKLKVIHQCLAMTLVFASGEFELPFDCGLVHIQQQMIIHYNYMLLQQFIR